jgi:3-keto-L-gulonate-6-phosphate decarboxylase
VYTVRPRSGVDVNDAPGPQSPFPHAVEIAVPGGVRPSDIRGATPANADGSYVGHSILDPAWKP